jgi:hypothetical protein
VQGDAGGSELTCGDGGGGAGTTGRRRWRSRGEGEGAATEKSRGGGGAATEEKSSRGKSRDGKRRGMPPGVTRPGRFPRENPAPAGPRHPCRGLPNSPERRPVENCHVEFRRGERPGFPAGKAAAKVARKEFWDAHCFKKKSFGMP